MEGIGVEYPSSDEEESTTTNPTPTTNELLPQRPMCKNQKGNERIQQLMKYSKRKGITYLQILHEKKDFHNPYLLSSLVSYYHINENKTNLSNQNLTPSFRME